MAEPNLATRAVSNVVHAHYGWYIVGMATTLQLTTNFVSQAFAILVVVMRDEFAWSLTAIVLAYFFRSMIGAVLAPVAGYLGDRYGAKRVMLVGAVLFVAGMLLLSTMDQVWQLYLYRYIVGWV